MKTNKQKREELPKLEKIIDEIKNDILFVQSDISRNILKDALSKFEQIHEEYSNVSESFKRRG